MADEWCPFASQSLFDRNIADETVRRKRNKRDVLHRRVCEAHALVIESIREQCCPSDFFRSSRPAAGTREWTNSSSMLAHVCVYAGVLLHADAMPAHCCLPHLRLIVVSTPSTLHSDKVLRSWKWRSVLAIVLALVMFFSPIPPMWRIGWGFTPGHRPTA